MRILQLIRSRNLAGSEQSVLTMSLELMRQGHEVHVAIRHGGPLAEIYRQAGLHVLDVNLAGLFASRRLRRHVEQADIDVVHAHLTGATRLAVGLSRATGVPCVAHARIVRNDPTYREAAGLGVLIANSAHTAERYVELGVPRDRIQVVHNATRVHETAEARLDPQAVRDAWIASLDLPADAQLITCLGRISPGKGQDVLVHAMAKLAADHPRAHLLVAGGQARRRTYVNELARLPERIGIGDRVRFVGFHTDIARLLLAADVHTVPSREEPFGLVVIEGMVLGRPVVASRVGGIPEILTRPELGTLVAPEDPDALADAIGAYLSDPDRARRTGALARQDALQRFTPEPMTRRIVEIYRQVIEVDHVAAHPC